MQKKMVKQNISSVELKKIESTKDIEPKKSNHTKKNRAKIKKQINPGVLKRAYIVNILVCLLGLIGAGIIMCVSAERYIGFNGNILARNAYIQSDIMVSIIFWGIMLAIILIIYYTIPEPDKTIIGNEKRSTKMKEQRKSQYKKIFILCCITWFASSIVSTLINSITGFDLGFARFEYLLFFYELLTTLVVIVFMLGFSAFVLCTPSSLFRNDKLS